MTRSRLLPFALGALVVACQGDRTTAPGGQAPSMAIVDGTVDGGNPDFFFLPPMVPNPNDDPDFGDGEFNPDLAPVVDICALTTDPTPVCVAGSPVAHFAGSDLTVSSGNQKYHLSWHTDEYALDVGVNYRVKVSIVGIVLGYADIDVVQNGGQAKHVAPGFVPLVNGRSLPIDFRIERGAFCDVDADCGEATVTNDGATVVTGSGEGGAEFPPDWLPDGTDQVLVIIERVTLEKGFPCLPIPLIQFTGCFRYRTIPEIAEFTLPVVVGVCLDAPESHPWAHLVQLFKWDEVNFRNVIPLENVVAPFVNCIDGGLAFGPGPSPWMQFVRGGIRRIADFVQPPLYAAPMVVHKGLGGLVGSFSRVGWAVPAVIEEVAGNGQSGAVGSTLPVDPTVRLISTHPEDAPLAGARVFFHFFAADGVTRIHTERVETDANGLASVSWVLDHAGTNRIEAWAQTFDSPIVFTATGTTP
ncbi:MAG TPA: hypothetical protein VGA37_14605 [Gemmatimonadales bacterium]